MKFLSSISLASLLLVVPAASQDFPREQDLSHLEGLQAPALAVTGWFNTAPLNLEEFKGKVVLIDFWGTW